MATGCSSGSASGCATGCRHSPPAPASSWWRARCATRRKRSLGVLDVAVERNAYGRQIDSAVAPITAARGAGLGGATLEGVFIRAPRVVEVGPGVEVLASRGADPVLVRQRAILAATFHPELSGGSPVIDLFLRIAGGAA